MLKTDSVAIRGPVNSCEEHHGNQTSGEVVITRMMLLTLSADHRIVDGGYAAEFLGQLKGFLEEPDVLNE